MTKVKLNTVQLSGKISRVGQLAYSPSGLALLEFTLAVPQEAYTKSSVGYYQVMAADNQAEELKGKLKVGMEVTIQGRLFQRAYTNRNGNRVEEVKVILESFGG